MIKSVRLINFFSFRDCEITLEPDVTVLVGINGSGKTNLLRAFELLKAGMEDELRETIATWGGSEAILCKNKLTAPTSNQQLAVCSFEIDKSSLPLFGALEIVDSLTYRLGVGRRPDSSGNTVGDILLGESKNGRIIWLEGGQTSWASSSGVLRTPDEVGRFPKNTDAHEVDTTPGLLLLPRLDNKELYPVQAATVKVVGDISLYSDFDTRARSPMRQSIQATGLDVLDSDGGNLFQILNTIQLKSTEAGDAIEKDLQAVNPNFERLQFQPLGQGGMLTYLREVGLKTPIPAAHVSDGTLRYLCLLAIAHNPDRGRLICLDEPERGLHPDMLAGVARLLLDDGHASPEAPRHTSYVVATHSPQLLSRFPLRCLRVFEKDENNQTVVRQFADDDIARFREWYDTFDAGSLWLKGELGGTRW